MRSLPRSGALALIACGVLAVARPAAAQTATATVRIGAQAIEPTAEAFYGSATGIFVGNGISPLVSTLGNGATIIQSVLAGDLDAGETNPLQLAVAIARGLPLQMIAPGCIYTKQVANPNVVVAKASPIKSPKDLIGATIGVGSLGDFNQLSLFAWLDANNVPRSSVKFVELPLPEIGAALERGTIQAGFITEPAKSEALRAGQIRDFADTYPAVAREVATVVWFTTKGWLQKNPDTARKLVSGIFATGKWANTHPRQSAELLAKITKTDLGVVSAMQRRLFATVNDRKYVEAMLGLAARYGMLQRPVTVEEFAAF